jgi:DNA-binding LytR/AlgR family response regulator
MAAWAVADIDMLVTDAGLPNGMNGRQVAEAVRERRPGMPMLFITGYAGTELPPDGEVIDKPFNLDTLAAGFRLPSPCDDGRASLARGTGSQETSAVRRRRL